MKTLPSNRSAIAALTLPEVLITVGVILILALVLVPAFVSPTGSRTKSARIACVGNLKNLGLSFRIWANDSSDLYQMHPDFKDPTIRADALDGRMFRVFLVMSNYLSVPKTVLCPADKRTAATNWNVFNNANISYFIGLDADDTKPNMLLTGDRNLVTDDKLLTGVVALGTNSPVTWTKDMHRENGNIGLADGSVQQVTTELFRQQLKNSGDATNLLVFPQ